MTTHTSSLRISASSCRHKTHPSRCILDARSCRPRHRGTTAVDQDTWSVGERRFAAREKGLCDDDLGAEDIKFGRCMELLGVKTGKTMDSMRGNRFHITSLILSSRFLEHGSYTGKDGALHVSYDVFSYR